MDYGFDKDKSVAVSKIALKMALSSYEEEKEYIEYYKNRKIKVAAVNVGGKMPDSRFKFIESTLIAAKRNNIISKEHVHDGSVIGAIREAMSQIETIINGLSVGGKIGIARDGEHLAVGILLSVGILQFNEVITAVAHRTLPVRDHEKDMFNY